jgi:hypothetical protein
MTTPDIAGLCERLRYRLDLESDNPYVVSAWSANDVLTRIVPHDDLEEIADTLERQAAEIARLQRLLNGRDDFIVAEGLWPKFCDGLPVRAALTGEDAGGTG